MPGLTIGIDLGTQNIVCAVFGKGVVVNEPCIAAFKNDKLIAVGSAAFEMLEKTPDYIKTVRPVTNGKISDFSTCVLILQYFISKIMKNMVLKPNIISCLPCAATGLDKKIMQDLFFEAGAARCEFLDASLCSGIGSGIDIQNEKGSMLVDIGAGLTDIAVIAKGKVIAQKTINTSSGAFDEAIIRQFRKDRNVIVSQRTAEKIKKRVGCAILPQVEFAVGQKGKNALNSLPVFFEADSTTCFKALSPSLNRLADGIKEVMEQVSAEIMADINETGLYLTGGGSLLKDLDKMLSKRLKVKTILVENPFESVARGLIFNCENKEESKNDRV